MRKRTGYATYHSPSRIGHLNRHYVYLWDAIKGNLDTEYIVNIQNGFPDIKTIKELRDKVRR